MIKRIAIAAAFLPFFFTVSSFAQTTDNYCVTCGEPDETYQCQLTSNNATSIANPSAKRLFCIVNIAKDHGHQSCSIEKTDGEICDGKLVSYDYKPSTTASQNTQGSPTTTGALAGGIQAAQKTDPVSTDGSKESTPPEDTKASQNQNSGQTQNTQNTELPQNEVQTQNGQQQQVAENAAQDSGNSRILPPGSGNSRILPPGSNSRKKTEDTSNSQQKNEAPVPDEQKPVSLKPEDHRQDAQQQQTPQQRSPAANEDIEEKPRKKRKGTAVGRALDDTGKAIGKTAKKAGSAVGSAFKCVVTLFNKC